MLFRCELEKKITGFRFEQITSSSAKILGNVNKKMMREREKGRQRTNFLQFRKQNDGSLSGNRDEVDQSNWKSGSGNP